MRRLPDGGDVRRMVQGFRIQRPFVSLETRGFWSCNPASFLLCGSVDVLVRTGKGEAARMTGEKGIFGRTDLLSPQADLESFRC